MEPGLSLSLGVVAEVETDTTLTRKEAVTADITAVAAVMAAEVATVDMVATIITEVDMEVVTISFNQDNTTIIIITIVMRVEIKRKILVVMAVEILISRNLLMEIIKQNGLSMDRKRNQRSQPQRRKKRAQKMMLRIHKKCIKV